MRGTFMIYDLRFMIGAGGRCGGLWLAATSAVARAEPTGSEIINR